LKIAKLGKKLTTSEKLRTVLYKAARASDYNNANPHLRKTMVNLISSDVLPLLHKITARTLIIWGKLDRSTPLTDGKLMHHSIKNSTFFVIDDARHSPQFTHTKEVCEKVLSEIM
jgi:pimeloyl-ACP methyl ester carboxylesterase